MLDVARSLGSGLAWKRCSPLSLTRPFKSPVRSAVYSCSLARTVRWPLLLPETPARDAFPRPDAGFSAFSNVSLAPRELIVRDTRMIPHSQASLQARVAYRRRHSGISCPPSRPVMPRFPRAAASSGVLYLDSHQPSSAFSEMDAPSSVIWPAKRHRD